MRMPSSIWIMSILVPAALFSAGCNSGDGENDDTPNVAFSGDEQELLDLGAVLALSDGTITIPYDPNIAPQLGAGYFSMTEEIVEHRIAARPA